MRTALLFAAALVAAPGSAQAQNPLRHPTEAAEIRFSPAQPVVHYTLTVDSANLGGFAVEMRIRNAPDSLRLAMSAHPEYDDRYWRYLQDLRIESPAGDASINRVDSAVWRVSAPGGESVVRYRIHLPEPESPRAAWRPFLAPTGGLVGGPHAFMYVVGHTLAPSHVTLDIPAGWQVATGLAPTSDPRTFFAPTVDALVEGPMFVGHGSTWRFAIDGVPHRVVYWRGPEAVPFDSVEFVRGIRLMAEQAVAMFGRAPWREYTFIFQDDAWGGLEHANSVTLGAESADLARDPHAQLPETAHEFFHGWNLMRIRPAEYRTVDYRTQPPTSGLWFSEGLTIFYADLLLRRAGLPVQAPTRAANLERILGRYLSQSGNARLSAEVVSRAAYNAEPDALGDYSASTHLQGEVIGTMLDLVIRDATDGRRSMDDVMRLMLDRFSGERGFLGPDVEGSVEEVCGCDVTPFFDAHVRGGSPIDFDRYLALIGMRARVASEPALNREGAPVADLGIWGYERAADNSFRLRISSPDNVWARAGLRTGDRVVSVNGTPVGTWPELRNILRVLRIGETVRVAVSRPTGPFTAQVMVVPLVQPVVRIEPLPSPSERARRIAREWEAGSAGGGR